MSLSLWPRLHHNYSRSVFNEAASDADAMGINQAVMQLEAIRDFLSQNLQGKDRRDLEKILSDLRIAASRYDRLAEHRAEWSSYRERRKRLQGLRRKVTELREGLRQLDMLSRDGLEVSLGVERYDAFQECARLLDDAVNAILNRLPKRGRPPDIAVQKWIHAVADIYWQAFKRKPSIGGSINPGRFHQLLEVSRPDSLRRYGTLHPRQVTRILRMSRRDQGGTRGIELPRKA